MPSSMDSGQLSALLGLSESLDIVGDVSVTVAHPSELLAWATALSHPSIVAWRGHVSGKRFVHVTALHGSDPIHGRVMAAMRADQHMDFWSTLLDGADLEPGEERTLAMQDLATAWEQMPLEIPETPAS